MRRLWIAIAVMMFAAVGRAGKAEAAGFYSGSRLLEYCESNSVADQNTCAGYLAGIDDITGTYDDWGVMNKDFCIPNSASTIQLLKVAIKGLNEMPERLHLRASGLVAFTFKKAFPCD